MDIREAMDADAAAILEMARLQVHRRAQGSIRFHERQGFVVVGRLPETGFKFGRWLERVLMERILAP